VVTEFGIAEFHLYLLVPPSPATNPHHPPRKPSTIGTTPSDREVPNVQIGQWIGILALGIGLYILWQIRNVLMLIFAAVVIATALNTLAEKIQTWVKVKRSGAIGLAIAALLAVLTLAIWLIVPPFADQFQQLTTLVPKGLDRFSEWLDSLRDTAPPSVAPYIPDVESLIPQLQKQLQPLANRFLSGSFTVVSGTLGSILNILLVLILTLMLLAEPEPYRKAFIRCFPSFYRRRIGDILDKCAASLKGWMIGVVFNMGVIGGLSGLGLLCLGVPLPLANGIFAGLLTFLPNIGAALSIIPPIAISLLDENAPWKPVAVFILYFVVQQIETNLLTPYVMAQQVSLLPAVTLMSQVFFATFFGFIGLVLALPLTVVGQVWLQEILVKDVLDLWTEEDHPPHLGEAFVEEPLPVVETPQPIATNASINVDQNSMITIEGQRPSASVNSDS
jgi:predicted PurR-regulated permease PerM